MLRLRAGIVALVVLLGGAALFLWTARQDATPGSAVVQEGASAAAHSGAPAEPERVVASPDVEAAPAPGSDGVASTLTVTGMVVDEQGAPVGEARVFHGDSSAGAFVLSDAGGRFTVSSTRTSLQLRAEKEGYRVSDVYETGRSQASPQGMRIVLRRASGTIRGTVADARGNPVEAAGIRVESGSRFRENISASGTVSRPRPQDTLSDARGAFDIAGVPPGKVEVLVRAEGHAPWRGKEEVRDGTVTELRIELAEPAILRGTVATEAGVPVEEAFLRAGPWDDWFRKTTSTDASGNYALMGLAEGTGTVRASKKEYVPVERTFQFENGREVGWDVTLRVMEEDPENDLIGWVVNGDGQPHAEWYVEAEYGDLAGQQQQDRTDGQGRFHFPGLLATDVSIRVLGPDFTRFTPLATAEHRAEDGEPLVIVVDDAQLAPALLCGRIVDAEGEPVEGAAVRVSHSVTRNSPHCKTVEGGEFSVELQAGSYEVEYGAAALGSAFWGTVDLVPGEYRDLGTLRLEEPGTWIIELQEERAEPRWDLDLAVVELWVQDSRSILLRGTPEARTTELSLLPGEYQVQVMRHGETLDTAYCRLGAGDTARSVLLLPPPRPFQFLFVEETPGGAAEISVSIAEQDGPVLHELLAQREAEGFRLRVFLEPGIYSITVREAGREQRLVAALGAAKEEPIRMVLHDRP